MFPTEEIESYVTYSFNKNIRKLKGKLYDSHSNYRIALRKVGIIGYITNKRRVATDSENEKDDDESNTVPIEFIKTEPEEFE